MLWALFLLTFLQTVHVSKKKTGFLLGRVYIQLFLELVSTSVDSNIRLWDLENGILLKSFNASPAEVWKAKFSPDAQIIVAGSHNGDINFFNVKLGEKINSLPTKNKFIISVAYVSFFFLLVRGVIHKNIFFFW